MSNLTCTEAAKWLKKKMRNAAVFARDKDPNSLCYADLIPMLPPNFSVILSTWNTGLAEYMSRSKGGCLQEFCAFALLFLH